MKKAYLPILFLSIFLCFGCQKKDDVKDIPYITNETYLNNPESLKDKVCFKLAIPDLGNSKKIYLTNFTSEIHNAPGISVYDNYIVLNDNKNPVEITILLDLENNKEPCLFRLSGTDINLVEEEGQKNSYTITLQPGENKIVIGTRIKWTDSDSSPSYNCAYINYENKSAWNLQKFEKAIISFHCSSDFLVSNFEDLSNFALKSKNVYFFKKENRTDLFWEDSTFPSKNLVFAYKDDKSVIYTKNSIKDHDELAISDDISLKQEPQNSSSDVTTIAKNSNVKIIEIGNAEEVDGILSNWLKVEVMKGAQDHNNNLIAPGTAGWCFGAYLKEPMPMSFSDDLEKAFAQSSEDYVTDDCAEIAKDWLIQIAQVDSTDALLSYCNECKTKTYFDRSFYTMPNPLIYVIRANWKEGFDALMEQYFELVNLKYESGKYSETIEYPLEEAVKSGNIYFVNRLLEMSADVNVETPEYLYSPLKDNLLTVCQNPEIEELLISKGIETSFKTDMKMTKCVPEKDSVVKLYDSPDKNAAFKEYEFTEDDAFTVTQVSYKKAEKFTEKTLSGYVQLGRWTKVSVNGESGWVKPGEIFLAYGYYEP